MKACVKYTLLDSIVWQALVRAEAVLHTIFLQDNKNHATMGIIPYAFVPTPEFACRPAKRSLQ